MHRFRRLGPAVVAVVAVGSAVAACGGDSGGSYVKNGNAICDEMNVAIPAALPDIQGVPTVSQVMPIATGLEPVLQRWRNELATLAPPTSRRTAHQALLDSLDKSIQLTHAAATTVAGPQAFIDAGGPPLDEPGNAAHALFKRCPAGD